MSLISKTMLRRCAGLAVSLAAVVVMLVALEASMRIYHWVRYDVPLQLGPDEMTRSSEQGIGSRLSFLTRDDVLGWRATPNYAYRGPARNMDGSTFELAMSQDSRGFRKFGDPRSARSRIMVIGDSYLLTCPD